MLVEDLAVPLWELLAVKGVLEVTAPPPASAAVAVVLPSSNGLVTSVPSSLPGISGRGPPIYFILPLIR